MTFGLIPCKSYLSSVKELDVFFTYSYTWRSSNRTELKNIASTHNAKIRVILPDNTKDEVLEELSRRFEKDANIIKTKIEEAENDFKSIFSVEGGAKIEIWKIPVVPLFTFYRFDNRIILALYSHHREKVPVPSFVIEKNGLLYEFICNEIKAMIGDGGIGEKVYEN